MDTHVRSITRAKKAAKSVRQYLGGLGIDYSLSKAQALVARWYGYRDWHELDAAAKRGPLCEADESLNHTARTVRLMRQEAIAIAEGVPQAHARSILAFVMPTAADHGAGGARGTSAPKEDTNPDVEESFNLLLDTIENFSEAGQLREFTRFTKHYPGFVDGHAHLGHVLLNMGQYEAALEAYDKGLSLVGAKRIRNANYSDLEDRPVRRAIHGKILALLKVGRSKEAIPLIRNCLRHDRRDGQGMRFLLIDALVDVGDYAAIPKAYKAAVPKDNVTHPASIHSLALAHFKLGNLVEAANAIRAGQCANRYIADLLLGRKSVPARLRTWSSDGSVETAQEYLEDNRRHWEAADGLLPFLEFIITSREVKAQHKRQIELMKGLEIEPVGPSRSALVMQLHQHEKDIETSDSSVLVAKFLGHEATPTANPARERTPFVIDEKGFGSHYKGNIFYRHDTRNAVFIGFITVWGPYIARLRKVGARYDDEGSVVYFPSLTLGRVTSHNRPFRHGDLAICKYNTDQPAIQLSDLSGDEMMAVVKAFGFNPGQPQGSHCRIRGSAAWKGLVAFVASKSKQWIAKQKEGSHLEGWLEAALKEASEDVLV